VLQTIFDVDSHGQDSLEHLSHHVGLSRHYWSRLPQAQSILWSHYQKTTAEPAKKGAKEGEECMIIRIEGKSRSVFTVNGAGP
jgi:hypothetical protein